MMPPENNTKTLEQELEDLSIGSNNSSSTQSEGGLSFDEDTTYIDSPSLNVEDEFNIRPDGSTAEEVETSKESQSLMANGDDVLLGAIGTFVEEYQEEERRDVEQPAASHPTFFVDEDHCDLKNEDNFKEELEDDEIESKPRIDLISALATIFSQTDPNESIKWHHRIQNRLVYRASYIPVPRESREMEQLIADIIWNKNAAAQDSSLFKFLYPSKDEPKSIIIKREHVTCCFVDEVEERTEIKEFVLLNHCLLILPVKLDFDLRTTDDEYIEHNHKQKPSSGFKDRILKSTKIKKATNGYDVCYPLSSIVSIEDYDMQFGDAVPLPSFGFKVLTEQRKVLHYKIHCFSEDFKDKWITSLRISVTCNLGVDEDSIYSYVLCNDLDGVVKKMILLQNIFEDKDMIDKVHRYSALHLAVITSKNLIAKHLLSAGVDANIAANDGSTPLISAEFFHNHEMIDILRKHETENHMQQQKSADYDSIKRADICITISNSTTNASDEDESDTVSASEAIKQYGRPNKHLPALMAGLQERGDKLSEIEMKTSNLKNAAFSYGSMAKLLKEQSEQKKKKKRFLFF